MLLIHGVGDNSTTWNSVHSKLAQRFTVIAPDLLGHGESDKPRADYSLASFANGMRDLLAVLGIDRVTLVGHSRGGHFAKALASRNPDEVSQVISMGSGLDEPFDISEPTRLAVEGVRRMVARRDPERGQQGCFTHTCVCRYSQDYRKPFPEQVPLTSIYSKGDGVVRWRACVVPYARCVEVTGSHIGLAFNRHAYREIATTLAPTA